MHFSYVVKGRPVTAMHRAVTSTGTWSCMRGWHRQHETLNGVAFIMAWIHH